MAGKEPVPLNFVHQNAILCETIKKEQKHQKLHKDYRVNPFKKSKFIRFVSVCILYIKSRAKILTIV